MDTLETIAAHCDARRAEQLDFLIALCDQNSFSAHKPGVDRVGAMVTQRLAPLVSEHEIIRRSDFGDHHVLRMGPRERVIYLVGHMDTVFPPDHPFQRCRVEGDWLHGPGTGDMKGGLAVFVFALEALAAAGRLGGLGITLLLNSDEERGSITSQPLFEREREHAAACLCGECAGPEGELVVSRNGKLGLRIESYGAARHVGRQTHEKSSAVLEIARRVVALEALNAAYPGVSLNVGRIEGGLGPATVAARATALGELRWVDEAHREPMLARIEEAITAPAPDGCHSAYEVLNARPAWARQEGSRRLWEQVQRAGERLGQTIGPEHRRGTSDANFFGVHGVPTLDGFGPLCEDDHTEDERILIPSLVERMKLLAGLLLALADDESKEAVE